MATFTSNNYDGRYLQLSISETVNVAANTSTLTWTLTSAGGSVSYYTVDTTTVVINGTTVYSKGRTDWDDRVFPAAKGSTSGTLTVAHNSNGTKTIDVSFTTRVYVYGPLEYGGTMTLTNIDRTAPTVSCSVTNITANGFQIGINSSATADRWYYSLDGGAASTLFSSVSGTSASTTLTSLAPNTTYQVRAMVRKQSNQVFAESTIIYVKTLGGAIINGVSTLTADNPSPQISINTTTYDATYTYTLALKNGSSTYLTISGLSWAKGTSVRTITLTSAQRTTLLQAMASIKSFTCTYALTTYSGSTQIGTTDTITGTVQTTAANSAPTMTAFTVKDGRSATSTITGNNQLFIQTYSYLYVTPGTATAKNGASIVKYAATCNGQTYSNTTGGEINLYGISDSGTLDVVVTATDSRGYTVSRTQTITVIPYAKPKVSEISLRRTNDIEAEMQLVFKGSISPITVSGTQKNSMKYVRYRYKLTSAGTYGSYTSILPAVTTTGTSFSYSNLELCNLDANSSYDFHIQIRDSLDSLSSTDLYFVIAQGTPLVALRKKKVGINTPTPSATLHVVGETRFEGNSQIVGNLRVQGTLTPDNLNYTFDFEKGIMVHSTGANNPNLKRYVGPDDGLLGKNQYNNHWNTYYPGGRKVCVHAFIGKLSDGTIATYQTLPWDHLGWHAGGSANDTHIGFEICEDGLTDGTYFKKVYQEAVELCAYLCKEFGLTEQNIICHSEGYKRGIASNHEDVMHWFPRHGKSMDTFRADVKALLNVSADTAPAEKPEDTTSAEKTIWDFLYSKIGNAYGTAGLMGNLFAESSLKPTNLQNTYEKKLGYTDAAYTEAVDNGTYDNFVNDSAGYGLAQWTFWSRKRGLLEFAKSQSKSIGDLDLQLAFIWKELAESYKSVLATLTAATSVMEASTAVLTKYERPADQGEAVQAKRASYGQTYYDRYAAVKYPEKLTTGYYRVRKAWKDSKSQVGAYRVLKNAKAAADKHPGTFVFTNDGVSIYPADATTQETYCIHTVVKGDTLWDIAQEYLGNGSRYPEIKTLNGLTSNVIYSGWKLKIPN